MKSKHIKYVLIKWQINTNYIYNFKKLLISAYTCRKYGWAILTLPWNLSTLKQKVVLFHLISILIKHTLLQKCIFICLITVVVQTSPLCKRRQICKTKWPFYQTAIMQFSKRENFHAKGNVVVSRLKPSIFINVSF